MGSYLPHLEPNFGSCSGTWLFGSHLLALRLKLCNLQGGICSGSSQNVDFIHSHRPCKLVAVPKWLHVPNFGKPKVLTDFTSLSTLLNQVSKVRKSNSQPVKTNFQLLCPKVKLGENIFHHQSIWENTKIPYLAPTGDQQIPTLKTGWEGGLRNTWPDPTQNIYCWPHPAQYKGTTLSISAASSFSPHPSLSSPWVG